MTRKSSYSEGGKGAEKGRRKSTGASKVSAGQETSPVGGVDNSRLPRSISHALLGSSTRAAALPPVATCKPVFATTGDQDGERCEMKFVNRYGQLVDPSELMSDPVSPSGEKTKLDLNKPLPLPPLSELPNTFSVGDLLIEKGQGVAGGNVPGGRRTSVSVGGSEGQELQTVYVSKLKKIYPDEGPEQERTEFKDGSKRSVAEEKKAEPESASSVDAYDADDPRLVGLPLSRPFP